MKRSHMINLMEKAFIQVAVVHSTTADKMEYILSEMEKAGMLPPEHFIPYPINPNNSISCQECESGFMTWEKE